ncbi:MAG TPA: glycosyltransferase [Stellaceae bacterium]|nr:glycosyltransferase [Stellaceae bacterium]
MRRLPLAPKLGSVSVVIPCFNASETIGETIQSAISQEGVDLDVLVIDDGSTDASMDIVRRFGSVTRILSRPHRGVSAARNLGIAETNSEWLVFLDSDDVLLPETLKKRLDAANATGADVIICDWQDIIGWGQTIPDKQVKSLDTSALATDGEIACATHVWATTAAVMYRRPMVEKIGGFREDLPVIQDARFLFDAAYHGARFAYSPHVGAWYRRLPESLSRRDPALFWRDVLLNGKQIETLWRTRGPLSPKQVNALFEIFENAARGLYAVAHPEFFEAANRQRMLAGQFSRHSLISLLLARVLGLNWARHLLRVVGR